MKKRKRKKKRRGEESEMEEKEEEKEEEGRKVSVLTILFYSLFDSIFRPKNISFLQ